MNASATLQDREFQTLRGFIEQQCGISLGQEKAYLVESRLSKLVAEHGCESFGQFCRLISGGVKPALRDKIVDAMTTNETLWFRDNHPFTILTDKILPDVLSQARGRRVRVWSAASSTGQEPYSVAMTILEYCRKHPQARPDQFEIVGTDISSSALFLAKAARYDRLAVQRGLPEDLRDRYFSQEGAVWVLNDDVKRLVQFRPFNLQDSPAALGTFDLVLLRYVAIYFSETFKRHVLDSVASVTRPGGYLLVGAVESLRGLSDRYDQLSHAGGQYYRRKA